jgi:hypothetical protein
LEGEWSTISKTADGEYLTLKILAPKTHLYGHKHRGAVIGELKIHLCYAVAMKERTSTWQNEAVFTYGRKRDMDNRSNNWRCKEKENQEAKKEKKNMRHILRIYCKQDT